MSSSTAIERTATTGPHPAAPAVPWLTVVPIAVLMSFADDYWMTSLRGAFGAIERTQDPFRSWLLESTILAPAFTLAVLAALILALRLFGPGLRAGRSVAVTALLIALAGTVVGMVILAVSSVYDYHLQGSQLQVMAAMGDRCPTHDCLDRQRQASLALQERSVLMGAGLIMLTNVVMVGWVVAARGGRLRVSTTRPTRALQQTRVEDLRILLAAGLAGSAVIHAAVVPEHLPEWPVAAAFFVALTAVELAVAGWLVLRPLSPSLLAAAISSAGPLVLWLCSRTIGLPFGPEPGVAEAVGLADIAACLLELATLALAVTLMVGQARLRHRTAAVPHLRWLALVAVLAVTTIGLSGSGVAGFNNFGTSHTPSSSISGHRG